MDDKLENLLIRLDSEIDRKCYELKEKKREQRNARLFALACGLFILIPILLMLAGVNILVIFFPVVIFFAFCMAVLSPIIINNNLGGPENERY
jgi:Flp pilus assembly protein TadB